MHLSPYSKFILILQFYIFLSLAHFCNYGSHLSGGKGGSWWEVNVCVIFSGVGGRRSHGRAIAGGKLAVGEMGCQNRRKSGGPGTVGS